MTQIDDDLLQRLQASFLEELEDRTRSMALLLAKPHDDPHRDEDLLDLYRSAHNIKGAARAVGSDDVQALCHELESLFALVREERRGLSPSEVEQAQRLVETARLLAVGNRTPAAAVGEAPGLAVPDRKTSMRVRVDRIDAVIGAAGEAFGVAKKVTADVQSLQDLEVLVRQWRTDPELAAHRDRHAALEMRLRSLRLTFSTDARRLERTLSRLTDDAHATRMVPVGDVWEGVERLVKEIAAHSGKKVDVVVGGQLAEIDREVAEQLREPVLQLAKNAVDHGLELPFERVAAGKATTGTIRVSATLDGDQVAVIVEDDGRGVDLAGVRERARRRGLVVPVRDEEALQLVFAPGLSTAARVTDVSGRGIGLESVRHAVAGLHGRITIESTPQRSTRFTLRVPLTLGVVRILTVRAGDLVVGLPAAQVVQLQRKKPSDLHRVDGVDGLFFDGEVVPVASLALLLGREPQPASRERHNIVIVNAAERIVALVVDELRLESEVLLLPLPARLAGLGLVSSVTQGERGALVPVLAVGPLLERAAHVGRAATQAPVVDAIARRRRVLVVDDSITTRTLTQSILQSADFDVVAASDGQHGLDALQDLRDGAFDIVVSDVDMPRMDGIELTRAIRATPRLAALPVVLLSGLGSDKDQQRGLEAGANAYLVKSRFEQSRLLEIVTQLIEQPQESP